MSTTSPTTKVIPSFDPFDVKTQLVELAENYFNLDDIDLYESGFMGYLIQALTTVTSDTLYQNAFAYNEAFLNRALLNSSVRNIASQLDYDIKSATPASGTMYLTVPVDVSESNRSSIKFPAGSSIDAGGISYKLYNTYYVKKDSSGIHVTSHNMDTGDVDSVPYNVELHDGQQCVAFGVEIWQVSIYTHEFEFDNPTLYQFYTESLSGYEGSVYKITVDVEGERYTKVDSLYTCDCDSRSYEMNIISGTSTDEDTKIKIKFGNGIYGYQSKSGSKCVVTIYTTLGSEGNIASNTASFNDRVVDILNADNGDLNVTGTNTLAINNGKDAETLEEIKKHVKENISSAKRLVTKTDYSGYAGITGLTNIAAYPVFYRRNINGNEIALYNALFDTTSSLVPTDTISYKIDDSVEKISKGQQLTFKGNDDDTDTIEFVSPFELIINKDYDVPYAQYIYNLSTTEVAPVLFTDSTPEDVEMSVKYCELKIYPNTSTYNALVEIYKLSDMDSGNISAKFKVNDTLESTMKFVSEYNDKTILNMSTSILPTSTLPIGEFTWTIELYYTYSDTNETVLYNTYKGTFNAFTNKSFNTVESVNSLTSTYTSSDVVVDSFTYIPYESDTNKVEFRVDVKYIGTTDSITSLPLDSQYLKMKCTFNDTDYEMQLYSIDKTNNRYVYHTPNIDVSDISTGSCVVKFIADKRISSTTTENAYTDFNTYTGNITIYNEAKTAISTAFTESPNYIGTPSIELIRASISDIIITSDDDGDSYNFACVLRKHYSNSSSNMIVTLSLYNSQYQLIDDTEYVMNYLGETAEASSEDDLKESTSVVYKSNPINTEDLPTGSIPFKIEIKYKVRGTMTSIVSYRQNVTFKQDISRIIRSDIHQFTDGYYYLCGIPVIEKSYYEDNIDYIDETLLSQFLNLNNKFNSYGMITDKINMKFVRTTGKSINMRLNTKMDSSSKMDYTDTFSIDLPVKIHAKVYVSKDVTKEISSISTEAKNIIYTFLTLKSGFNKNIYRSEISRFLHDSLDDILFCEIVEPTDEIIYDFDIDNLKNETDKDLFYTYTPEYIWFDLDSIVVDVLLM